MPEVVWTAPAVDDLEAIHDFISRDSEVYADAVVQSLFEGVDRLQSFPMSGRVVPELSDPRTREIVVGRYRVLYDVGGSVIRILAVLHGARQFPENL